MGQGKDAIRSVKQGLSALRALGGKKVMEALGSCLRPLSSCGAGVNLFMLLGGEFMWSPDELK